MKAEKAMDAKIYIPYESAEFCIMQIAGDMQTMKNKHQEMVQELEENYRIASRENQERTVQTICSHYQNKLHALKRILDLYQEKVEKKNSHWEERINSVSRQNETLQEDLRAEKNRSREEALQWQREKNKMLELFSTRLDLLHSHQASTLQELQMAREEVGKVQEMLKTSSQVENQQQDLSTEAGHALDNVYGPVHQTEGCSDTELPLEGAQARLEELKESLYKREREITELLDAEQTPIPPIPVAQPPCAVLLRTVVEKAHHVCSKVSEARLLLDHMLEDNCVALAQARDILDHMSPITEDDTNCKEEDNPDPEWSDSSDERASKLLLLQETLRECEITQMALDCIRVGASPSLSAPELEEILVKGEGVKSVCQQFLILQDQMKQLREENRQLVENYTSERIMRKKYYNMVNDMKGKIRVYCRIRPMCWAETAQGGAIIVERLDQYSVSVVTPRGLREFQFDQVFSEESSQEDVFQDINRLIQSAIDGYNVCIFAYGQTGSGKTFSMVGDRDQRNPGIMPRAFNAIFDIIQENATKFECKVSAYMLELYNDRLQDLFVSGAGAQTRRVEIKRNRKGLVFAQGAETKEASSAGELFAMFQQACASRHITATKMNVESSRSHLIIGIMLESRNLTNGSVSFGKLSLVDLAGSERAAKTGARDDQLKEATSINKSLSALGDVISALSLELPHIPYRNSKLTQIMQDSLGGNAKTLMIVNVSPCDCNLEETLTSLTYATRVKAITNSAQRNLESKEIAQLKEVILKLKAGQPVDDVDI
ncbi:kinesin-like protein KIN-14E [Esox lucius]|uniref:Kinesin-like protein n=1 Tax=Esox lucius TaxID=8010 RepID=A0AAY5L1Z0_ESOLU|nr:kinesin-like protein KIN-14E [Esox lucius]